MGKTPKPSHVCIPQEILDEAELLTLEDLATLQQIHFDGLMRLENMGLEFWIPQAPRAPGQRGLSKVKIPLFWDRFLELCQEHRGLISVEGRNYVLEIIQTSHPRVTDGDMAEVLKVMFSSPAQLMGTRGHLYSLKTLLDDPRYVDAVFELEAAAYELNRRYDVEMRFPDGRVIRVEVKAYEGVDFADARIWDTLLGETGQFTRDIAGAIDRADSIDSLFDDLLYFFPDPVQFPNVDLGRVREAFVLPNINGDVQVNAVPALIADAVNRKGFDIQDVYDRLELRLSGDMIRTYSGPF